jgi:hypothetical integral membrane protein (TIGR02206 family)
MEFQTFGRQHLVMLAIIAAMCFFVAWKNRSLEESGRKWMGRLIGFVLLSYALFFYIQQAIAGELAWEYSLPLELCNLVLIACIISMFRPNNFITEVAYFWGLGGVVQATVTPDLARGFPSLDFVLFFWSHGATLVAITFLISGRGFRPRKGCILRMMIALNLYGLVVGTIDAIGGWNYGYLRHKPAVPSLLDYLGPWPWYLVSLEAVAFVTFLILLLPWRLYEASTQSGAKDEERHGFHRFH